MIGAKNRAAMDFPAKKRPLRACAALTELAAASNLTACKQSMSVYIQHMHAMKYGKDFHGHLHATQEDHSFVNDHVDAETH